MHIILGSMDKTSQSIIFNKTIGKTLERDEQKEFSILTLRISTVMRRYYVKPRIAALCTSLLQQNLINM